MSDEAQGNDLTPLTLPDYGNHWRWLGGVTPPICQRCKQEPGIANYAGRVVGWGCLRALVGQEGNGDEGEGNDEGTGGVREPRSPLPSPGGLEVEVEVEV